MRSRKVRFVLALALIALGGLSVHYTLDDGAEHHREWAVEHHMPEPQPAITIGGWIAVALGAAVLVATFRTRRA